MTWQKRGLIFSPNDEGGWMRSHAQVPTPLLLDDVIRIYFSSRPEKNLSQTTFLDVERSNPAKIVRVNEEPLLRLGKPGTFDEHGIMPSCAVRDGDRILLYYSGWSRAASVPYTNSTGLAISSDYGQNFRKVSEGPILSKSIHDPYSATSPCVLKEGNDWHMWYCSGTGWLEMDGKYEHVYDIKHAVSKDGITWSTDGQTAIGPATDSEALTRPFVTRDARGYHMWFCYRGSRDFRDGDDAYRIGYAYSGDLTTWQRRDEEAGISISADGWDSRMIAYPAVISLGESSLMFYNGNGFGRDGFGYAEWTD